jgi:hypothetical protein
VRLLRRDRAVTRRQPCQELWNDGRAVVDLRERLAWKKAGSSGWPRPRNDKLVADASQASSGARGDFVIFGFNDEDKVVG